MFTKDSLGRPHIRVALTLVASVLRSALSLASGLVIARSLGAASFGDLGFLVASFLAIGQLTDMGSSSAFYTFMSRRRQSGRFLFAYLGWAAAQFFVIACVLGVLPSALLSRLFFSHDRLLVLLAFSAVFAQHHLWNLVSQLGEAAKRTAAVQAIGLVPAVVHFLAVLLLARYGALSVEAVLWLTAGEYVFVAAVLGPGLIRWHLRDAPEEPEWRDGLRAFLAYCRPLVLYTWVSFAYGFADRWLLQGLGGSVQQGYFSLGQQFAAISLLFTAAVLRVFWKEVAEARERGEHERSSRLFFSASRSLFFLSTAMCAMVMPFSPEVLAWTVGAAFEGAWLAMAVLMLFPAFQTVGQIQGAFLYATGETKAYAVLSIVIMLLSLPITYLFLASPEAVVAGLGLGALGVAVKMLLVQFVTVTVQAWLIARKNGWGTDLGLRVILPAAMVAAAFGSRAVIEKLLGTGPSGLLEPMTVAICGFLYLVLVCGAFWAWPFLGGLSRKELRGLVG